MSSAIVTLPTGQRLTGEQLLEPWKRRAKSGLAARKAFEGQWLENQAAAAGQQWLRVVERGGRQLVDIRDELRRQNRSVQEADVLTQNLWTALGILYADEFRPELLAYHSDAEADEVTKTFNTIFGWGWDEEWKGDTALFDLLLTLGTLGTGAVQPRFDRSLGQFLGQVPHPSEDFAYTDSENLDGDGLPVQTTYRAGKPILDGPAARAFVADKQSYGEDAGLRPLREGAIRWPVLSAWNLITPPAVENAVDFSWEIIVRPAATETLRDTYGDRAASVQAESIEAMNVLGLRDLSVSNSDTPGAAPKLEGHALLYTGYRRPCGKYPQGQTVVWAGDTVLAVDQKLPLTEGPQGPRSGITYFRYWKVKGRFWGRALIEPGIGPQRTRNKRLSQQDEIMDRGGPKVFVNEGDLARDPSGSMMEVVELKPGAQPPKIDPGIPPHQGFKDSIAQCDIDIERGMGLHETSIGASAPAGTPYAALAQQAANDQTKLGPIVGEFKLGVAEVCRDTIPLMRQWPEGKEMMIVGDEDRLGLVSYRRQMLPAQYLVRPAKGGGLPRSQGAELQKITDLWTAAETSGVAAQDPVAWLAWYRESLDSGQAQEFPEMNAKQQQMHKAALENAFMIRTGELVPVAPYDDPAVHIPEHDAEQAQLAQAAMEGDERAALLSEVIERHKQLHLQAAQQNAATAPPALMNGASPAPAAGPAPPTAPPAAGPAPPLPPGPFG